MRSVQLDQYYVRGCGSESLCDHADNQPPISFWAMYHRRGNTLMVTELSCFVLCCFESVFKHYWAEQIGINWPTLCCSFRSLTPLYSFHHHTRLQKPEVHALLVGCFALPILHIKQATTVKPLLVLYRRF